MPYVKEAALQFLLEASQNIYPREFVGLLRGEGDLISEILVLPASIYGEGFARVKWAVVPIDKSIVGSVHSHPSPNNSPSRGDLTYFRKTGKTHLIAGHPFESLADVACYDNMGESLNLWMVE
jgi:proteasome lid subunit RPN8/RPN11